MPPAEIQFHFSHADCQLPDSFSVRLSAAQRQALGPLLEGLSTGEPYGGYLELLGRYHTMPVIAAGNTSGTISSRIARTTA